MWLILVCFRAILGVFVGFFCMLALLRRVSFLTTFYCLYFSHHYTYIANYIFFVICVYILLCVKILEISEIFESTTQFKVRRSSDCIQIQINQLLIFIEKFSPLPGFEPRTSRLPSPCATNWAIQAWINSRVSLIVDKLFVHFEVILAEH